MSDRKRKRTVACRITLKENVMALWNTVKEDLGQGDKTNSEFANMLLEQTSDIFWERLSKLSMCLEVDSPYFSTLIFFI